MTRPDQTRPDQTRPDQTRPDQTRPAYDSSFFHTKYSGRKILVLCPHQDDEINVAGNAIQNFTQAGAEVYVVYANSGDHGTHYDFDVRMTEAANSLKLLGVDKSHIFILGYGESFNNAESGHIFYTTDNAITSTKGHTETYGAIGLQDYGFLAHGVHSPYCRNNYVRDLRELMLQVRADVIIATDFDYHADHRMMSISFDEVIGQILSRPGNDYFPEVFRRFAYCTGWRNKPDFFDSDFILSTAKPVPMVTVQYDRQIIDTSYYSWPERVRFPVPEASREPYDRNILAQALKQHVSQKAHAHAENVINSDEVSWRRRTDSLSFSAKVTATSGNPEYVHDFRLLNVSEIDSDAPAWENYLWIPDEDDSAKELVFTWDSPQEISQVRLWGNVDGAPVERISVSMNTGYSTEAGPLPEKGLPLTLNIPAQSGVTECRLRILAQGSGGSGLAEVEFFAQDEQPPVVMPFVQITTGGNFVYVYPRRPDELSIPVECYCYRCGSPVKWTVEGSARLEGGNLVFEAGNTGDVVLTAETGNGLYCRSIFRTVSAGDIAEGRKARARGKREVRFAAFVYTNQGRLRNYGNLLFRKGPVFMLKTLMGKVTKKIRRRLFRR